MSPRNLLPSLRRPCPGGSGGPPLAASLAAVLLVSGGCSLFREAAARYPSPDLEAIYTDVAAGREHRPVVLVHGFAGSTLARRSDEARVWGAFFTKDALLPSRQPGVEALALDIQALGQPLTHRSVAAIDDDTVAVNLLERVEADAKVGSINITLYGKLVDLVESAGYGPCTGDPRGHTPGDGPPCFTFFYDWRQDNASSAIELGRFLEEAADALGEDEPVKFDVVAHSMGGLVSRYYLRYGARDVLDEPDAEVSWAGAERIDRLILISTPNLGSMEVLDDLIVGQTYPVVSYEPAVIATWASVYQLLPREHHDVWVDLTGGVRPDVLFSAQTWRDGGWGAFRPDQERYLEWILPELPSPEARRDRMAEFTDAAFERARRFAEAMDRTPERPSPAQKVLFAGDSEPTQAKAALRLRKGRLELLFKKAGGVQLKAPGDGSVTRASALADLRLLAPGESESPISWNRVVFVSDRHRSLLGNPNLHNNLLHYLLVGR